MWVNVIALKICLPGEDTGSEDKENYQTSNDIRSEL